MGSRANRRSHLSDGDRDEGQAICCCAPRSNRCERRVLGEGCVFERGYGPVYSRG